MKISAKLGISFMAMTAIPLLFVSHVFFYNAQLNLRREIFSKLEVITQFKAYQLEAFFQECKNDLLFNQNRIIAKTYLSILASFGNDRANPDYLEAKKVVDAQLKWFLTVRPYTDIMLLNKEGLVIYVSNPAHTSQLDHPLPGPDKNAFEKAKDRLYLGEIFQSKKLGYPLGLLLVAGVRNDQNELIGGVAMELNAYSIYRMIQDDTHLGKTGETLLSKKISDTMVLFLSPLRYGTDGILKKQVQIGSRTAYPAQEAALGKNGIGVSEDYRGEKVLSCWRYIPSMGWGLVTKIDADEALRPVEQLKTLIILLFLITLGFVIIGGMLLARSLSEPLQKLQKSAKIIGEGDLNHLIAAETKDEIGQLAKVFDWMRGKLKESHEDLERKVKERTEALGKSNDELSKVNKFFVTREIRMAELQRKSGAS